MDNDDNDTTTVMDEETNEHHVLYNPSTTEEETATTATSDKSIVHLIRHLYEESGCDKRLLCMLCWGVKTSADDPSPLMDYTQYPWNLLPRKEVKPSLADWKTEVSRRASSMSMRQPKPKFWNVERCTQWILQYARMPENDEPTMAYLRQEVFNWCEKIIEQHEATVDYEGEDDEDGRRRRRVHEAIPHGNWVAPVAHLRLILCLTQNECQLAFLKQQQPPRKDSTGAPLRHSLVLPLVYTLLAEKWNDRMFNPVAPPSTCHEDFQEEIDCSHAQVQHMKRATPQKVKDLLDHFCTELFRIVKEWEKKAIPSLESSDESAAEDDDNVLDPSSISRSFGALADRPAAALEARERFLKGHKPSYLLYFWEVADQHRLLYTALSCLDQDTILTPGAHAHSSMIYRKKRSILPRPPTGGGGEWTHQNDTTPGVTITPITTTTTQANGQNNAIVALGLESLAASQTAIAQAMATASQAQERDRKRNRLQTRIYELEDRQQRFREEAILARSRAVHYDSECKRLERDIENLLTQLSITR